MLAEKFLLVLHVLSLLMSLSAAQNAGIPIVKASPSPYQGDLILNGNNVTKIEGTFDINGSIIIEENATLILKNATLNFVQTTAYQHNMILQNPANGKPRLQAENATITSSTWFSIEFRHNSSGMFSETTINYYLELYEDSVSTFTDSTIHWVVMHNNASLSASHSTIDNLNIYGPPHVSTFDSTIQRFMISPILVNCSIDNIGPRYFEFWNYQLNTSTVVAPNGQAPDVTIRRSTVNDWAFWFQVSCNATISNSVFSYLRLYTGSVGWLVNVTTNQLECWLDARAYVSWYLGVHVVDSIGQNVPLASVTATYPNATVAETEVTDADGWARLVLMEKMVNTTGEYPVGNYTVEAFYDIYWNETTVNMTGNKQVVLVLESFIIPEFPPMSITPLFMIATLLAVIIYRRKHAT